MDKNLKDTELESVTGGKAPELPATQLEGSEYSGMFPTPQGLDRKEIHIYKNGIADPDSFTAKVKADENK